MRILIALALLASLPGCVTTAVAVTAALAAGAGAAAGSYCASAEPADAARAGCPVVE